MSKIVCPYINLSKEGEEIRLMRIRGQFHESDFAGMGYPVILALLSREGSAPDRRWIVQPSGLQICQDSNKNAHQLNCFLNEMVTPHFIGFVFILLHLALK